ncbi:PAS-domain containing protein [Roseococcus sp. SDR]|uniref:PAS-domain containing protein n=1 Tax=Roseococcus sp. SDR TaxID=2835532 RepID=UPI001BCDAB03|nr:PAS-domain containing protein [Roseococcus sp. SDR]MBS7792112.1 PAS-domain containing protein [Roseococcus sp. SDR]MBV1847426.1 PAS-domain containing protein [Roseococcus sp. SDR]
MDAAAPRPPELLTALPLALMAFSGAGGLVFANPAMHALLKVDHAALQPGAALADVLRLLAYRGVLGPGDPGQRLREVLALDLGLAHRRLLRDVEGRGLEWRILPLPDGGHLLTLADVSEFQSAREAAEREAAALSGMLARLNNGVAQYDAERRLARSNPAYARLLGLQPHVLRPGMALGEIVAHQQEAGEFDAAEAAAVAAHLAARSIVQPWRHERTRPDGRTVRFDNQPMPDGGWLVEIMDITDAHQAEQDVRRRVALQDALMEALPVGVAVYGPDRVLTQVNPAYNRIMAHSPVRLGENLRDILMRRAIAGEFGPCDPEVEVPRRLASTATSHGFERRTPEGIATSHRSVPLPDGGHAMVVADVTALHAAQAEARERAEVLAHMLESTRHGMAMFDAEGTVIAANRLAAHFCGLPPEAFRRGVNIRELRALQIQLGVHGDKLSTDRFLAERMNEPLRGPDRYRRTNPDGTVIEIITDKLPEGGYVRSFTDVTAQVQAEAEATSRAASLQAVLDNMRHGVILYDGEGYVRTGNALGARLAGLPPEMLKPGVHFDALRDMQAELGEHGEGEIGVRWRQNRAREPWKGEGTFTRKRPDGTIIEVRTDLIPGGGCVRSFTDITALTEAQAAATQRAAMVQAMLDNMRHGIALFDAQDRLLTFNRLCATLMGLEGWLRPGLDYSEVLARQLETGEFGESGAAADHVAALLTRDKSVPNTVRRRRPTGEELDVTASPVPQGGFVLTLTDITARVVAEREAERRAEVLSATLNAARQGIMLFDAEGRVVAANDIAAQLTTRAGPASLIGRGHADIVGSQHRTEGASEAEVEQVMRQVAAVDRRAHHRYQRHRRDGLVLDISSDPMPEGGYVVCISDVTDLVHAREQAQARAALLSATLNAARQGITLFDADGVVLAANDIGAQFAGLPDAAALIGRRHADIVAAQRVHEGATPEQQAELARRFAATDRTKPHCYQRQRPDGRIFDISSDPMPEGGYVVCISDVTDLVRANEQAQAQAAALSATLDASRHGITLYGPDHRVIATNRISTAIAGYASPEAMVGQSFAEVMRNQAPLEQLADPEAEAAFLRQALALDRTKPIRYQRRRTTGEVFDVASDPTPEGGFVVSVSDVTPLVDAQEEAQRRAGILQAMLENSRQGIVLYDAQHRLVAANALAGEMMGVPDLLSRPGTNQAEILAAQRARGLYGGEDGGAAQERFFLEIDRSKPHRMQRSLPDGRRYDVASDPTPDGGFVISVSDITPLVRAEAAAEQRAGLLRTMLENNTSGVLLYDSERRLRGFNSLAVTLTAMPDLSECLGMRIEDLLARQSRTGNLGNPADAERERRRLIALDRSQPSRGQRVTQDGRVLNFASDPTPDGGFVVSLTDVTPLARAEAEAKRRAEILGVMLGNIRHGIVLFDKDGRLVASNAKLQQMLGLPEAALAPGAHMHEMVDALRAQGEYGEAEAGERVAEAIKNRPRFAPIRSLRPRPDGTVLEVVSDPTPDGGWVVTYTDVTEDRQIRGELEAAREAAEAASRAKSRFLATMSHELRTPLNAVIGFADVLCSGAAPAQTEEFAQAIREAGQHLLSLIDDILDITRTETSNPPIALEEVVLREVIDGAARMIGPAIAAGGLQLVREIQDGLPRLRGDTRRLRQVLLNLLSNATKFTEVGGTVTLRAFHTEAGLTMEVQDTGIGIEAKDLERVFEPFTQLDSALSRRFPGSGLGLHLCRSLTQAQGGVLILESTPGVGTTARITFPASSLIF